MAAMKPQLKGAAKRLALSLLAATALGGCAVYDPAYSGYPGYTYDPYYYPYGAPAYGGVPYYAGPPVSLGLWFESRSGGHRGHHGGHGWHGGHGEHGGHGGRGGGWAGRGR